jgi:hypothetical protein
LPEIIEHPSIDIEGNHRLFGSHRTGQAKRKVATACTDIDDRLSVAELQGLYHHIGLLPLVALWVFEKSNVLIERHRMMRSGMICRRGFSSEPSSKVAQVRFLRLHVE